MLSDVERDTAPVFSEPAEAEISLLDLIIVVVRHRWMIAKVTLGMTLVGLIVSFLLPVRYTASTAILPPLQGGSAGSALMSQLGSLSSVASMAGGGSLGLKNPNDLQVALLQSRTIEDEMVDRFDLIKLYREKRRSLARKDLEKAVDIESGSKDGLIRISVTDRDPRRAADMANGYVEEFKKYSAGLAVTEASQRRLFFEQQLSQAKDNLANAEEQLKRTEQKTGMIQLDSQARAAIGLVADLRGQIAAKEVQISGMQAFATGENPDLQLAQQQLASLRSQEERMGANPDGVSNVMMPKGNLQEAGIEYVRKLRDVKYFETIFDLLARQYEVAKVDEARQGALVQIVDQAVVPDHRSSPMRTVITLIAAVLGLIFGTAWAFSTEGVNRLSKNPAERSRLETLKRLISRQSKHEIR